MNNSTCYKCERRTLKCHDACEDYKAFLEREREKTRYLKDVFSNSKEIDFRLRQKDVFRGKRR